MFQNLRKQQQIYILYKDDSPRVEIGTVEDVSKPYPISIPSTQPMPYPQMEMVVNVVVRTENDTLTLKQLLANADISDYGRKRIQGLYGSYFHSGEYIFRTYGSDKRFCSVQRMYLTDIHSGRYLQGTDCKQEHIKCVCGLCAF